jgi:predicted ATPase
MSVAMGTSVAHGVSVTLLGGFGAAVDGVPVDQRAWRLRKAREIVKLLALAPGHRLHREQVMDVLWRDREPAAAANNLNQAVYAARSALGARAIEVREGMLTLTADVDVDRLERAAAEARRTETPAAYRSALSLYSGELLPENRYDDRVEDRRDQVAELVATLEEQLSRLTDEDGCRPYSLPSDTSSFVGRGRELAELRALSSGTRLLTLVGTGGVGKTRLALELARATEQAYTGGAALVELGLLTDASLVPEAIAAALDVHALSGQSPLEAVVEFLDAWPVLLVIDNCEHLLEAVSGLTGDLLRSTPHLAILATSREPLGAPGEVVFRVPSLDIPDPELGLTSDQLLGFEAVRLFVDRARAGAPGFALDENNASDVARICFRLDGLPLALELAAGRLAALGAAVIAERLDDRFRVLGSAGHASPTRQQTLAATLDWSHDLLHSAERTLFRRLAVFAGSFDLRAVERVCAGGELAAPDIPNLLARLVEKSLIAIDEGSSRQRRFRLLETVHVYAHERLVGAGETQPVQDAHARWALVLAEKRGGSPRLDRDAANMRAALDTLQHRSPADALRLCAALLPFWMRRIDLDEGQRRLQQALAAAPDRTPARSLALLDAAAIEYRSGAIARGLAHAQESYAVAAEIGDARAQWRALQFLGECGLASGDVRGVAIGWLERALELARREAFAAAEATGVHALGIAHWMLGDLVAAEELVALSVERFGALTGSSERITSPVTFAETSQPGGRAGLRVVFEDTLQPFVEISCEAAAGYALASRAGIVRAQGDLTRARLLLDESAARLADCDDEQGESMVLVRRAYLELAAGAIPAARGALDDALELRRRRRDRRGVGLVLTGIGLIDTIAGDYTGAQHYLAEAHEIFRRAGDRWGLASVLWRIADLALARGQLDEAESALQDARGVLGPTQRERWIANTLAGLAEVALRRGDVKRATALLADARERYASRHDALGVADVERRLREVAKCRATMPTRMRHVSGTARTTAAGRH